VKAILIAIFLVCLFIELAAPGFGVFGSAAIIALLILVGAPALVGMAQWWHILLIVVGLGLIATELFLLPGFGVAGAAGILCLLVGLVGTFVSGDITTAEGRSQMWTGLLVTLTSGFLAGIIIWFISRQLHSFPLLNRLVLQTELKDPALAGAGGVGVLQAMGAPARDLQVGEIGIAETDLRPAGRAMFNGRLIDVKSAGGYIDRGTPVRIVSLGRFVIEVEEATT
jgi:membrane-bound serine protease (ClpP class)